MTANPDYLYIPIKRSEVVELLKRADSSAGKAFKDAVFAEVGRALAVPAKTIIINKDFVEGEGYV